MRYILSSTRFHLSPLLNLVFTLYIFTTVLFISSCSPGPGEPEQIGETQTTTIYGRIIDESGSAITGVSVASGTNIVLTDANGIFVLKDVTVPKGRAVVIAKKAGYFNAARAEVPNSNGTTRMTLSMMKNTLTKSISAIDGGIVTSSDGGSVAFQPGSFKDASGNIYSGTVNVAVHYLNPKEPSFFDYFSGDNLGRTNDGKLASLISCGVLRVEIREPSGNMLYLDSTKPATLNFPKPLDGLAPTSMPLWYFDENNGMWKQEGIASFADGEYTGTVTHFTDWNCDYINRYINNYVDSSGYLSLRVVCDGKPVEGVVVSFTEDDGAGKYFVYGDLITDANGQIRSARLIQNRPFQIEIRSDRNNTFYYSNTPIPVTLSALQSLDIGDVVLSSPCPGIVSGTLVCNGSKTEGLVSVTAGKYVYYSYTRTGDFSLQAISGAPLVFNATEPNGNSIAPLGLPALTSSQEFNIGEISLCSNGSYYLDIPMRSGSTFCFSDDGTRLAVSGNSGDKLLTIYDTKNGNVICSSNAINSSGYGWGYYSSMYFSADNTKILCGTQLYDISGTTAIPTVKVNDPNGKPKLSLDGTKIIATVAKGQFMIYSSVDGSLIKKMSNPDHAIYYFGYIRDLHATFYEGVDYTIHVWGLDEDKEIYSFPVSGYSSFSQDAATLASKSPTGTDFFDTRTGKKIGRSDSTSISLELASKNYAVYRTVLNNTIVVKIFDITKGSFITRMLPLTKNLSSGTYWSPEVVISPNEEFVAVGPWTTGSNGWYSSSIRIWKIK